MRMKDEIAEMKAGKKHEDVSETTGYNHGLRDGWIHALEWMEGD